MWGSSEAMGRATALLAQAPERTLEGGPRLKWPIGGAPRPPTCPSRGNRPGWGGNRGGRGSSSPALSSKPSQPPSPEVTSGLRGLHHGFNFSDLDACQVKYFNSVDSSSRSRFPWQRGLTHPPRVTAVVSPITPQTAVRRPGLCLAGPLPPHPHPVT